MEAPSCTECGTQGAWLCDRCTAALRHRLDIDDDVMTVQLVMPGDGFGPQWRDVRLGLFGVPNSSPHPEAPIFVLNGDDGRPLPLELRRQKVWLKGTTALHIERTWSAERGTRTVLVGLDGVTSEAALPVLRTLDLLNRGPRRGRPRNLTPDENRAQIVCAYLSVAKTPPTQAAVAEQLGISDRQLQRRLNQIPVKWGVFKAESEKLRRHLSSAGN